MDPTSCFGVNFKFPLSFLPPVFILVFVFGLIANGWGLNSLWRNWKKLGNVNVFILNLGIADILYLLTLPFLVAYYLNDRKWIFGEAFCKVTRFCFNLNLYCSIGFLTCISVYRYLAIVHPMKVQGRLTVTHSVIISAIVWILVSLQSLPDMFFPKNSANMTLNMTLQCVDTTVIEYVEDYLQYSLIWTIIGFCIPSLITVACYGHVIVLLCYKDNIDKVLKQRSLKLLIILILLFSICYIPYHVLKNFNLWSRVLSKQKICYKWSNGVYIAQRICRGLVCLNGALNPLVYLHVDEDISAQFRQLCQRTRQAASQLSANTQTLFSSTFRNT
ncbi:P2Y purinoceptor 1-like [Poecilia latipinna]|uniref:P2Y purinoceptor 1-like n=1 Tax=Poecilia latipinna TaxID=48699 RepID=UPI00072EB0CE|nr:PREDICTED: P2Y purinoceptor 1-like [Poecilia latipinna]